MPTYSYVEFRRIARALRKDIAQIAAVAESLEAAALWYRLTRRRPLRTSPSLMARRSKKIADAAGRLLLHLGVSNPDDATNGPGDIEVQELLASAEDGDEDPVIEATARIGRLVEILQAVEAAAQIHRRARNSVGDVVRFGDLTVPKGHVGNDAANDWIAAMLPLYGRITGKRPGTSVGAIGRANEGLAGGPLLRFLAAAGHPVKVRYSPQAWHRRVRDLLRARSRKN
jgi:hypothetical protein